jgi:hypothetical protein
MNERRRSRQVDNIKIDLEDIGRGGMDTNDLVQDKNRWRALVSMVIKFRAPKNVGKWPSSVEVLPAAYF